MNWVLPRDVVSLKVTLPPWHVAGKPFDPPILVSAIGARFPVNSDDLYLARIFLDRIGDFPVTRSKLQTEEVLEGELETGLTTELDGMFFFLFDQKAEGTLKPLQLGGWTMGQSYTFVIQIFVCRFNRGPEGDYWNQEELVGEVSTNEIAARSWLVRGSPPKFWPDCQLSQAIAGMRFTNPTRSLEEMMDLHPTRECHGDTAEGPWRTLAREP
ncbi:Uncharacterized protein TPAR_02244 [Tolypocladium paradoxum]|uniref:Uncharacterized protein n=1 Tax=Tolypocladium paradoxum TaxID=94208 RepID=A0A2S4L563_9HYPO|nr:Uncharacterized protein TPAR_02244 [Tolypocladium paradoxum]